MVLQVIEDTCRHSWICMDHKKLNANVVQQTGGPCTCTQEDCRANEPGTLSAEHKGTWGTTFSEFPAWNFGLSKCSGAAEGCDGSSTVVPLPLVTCAPAPLPSKRSNRSHLRFQVPSHESEHVHVPHLHVEHEILVEVVCLRQSPAQTLHVPHPWRRDQEKGLPPGGGGIKCEV